MSRTPLTRLLGVSALAASLGLAACTQESPTEVGGVLLPGTQVSTFEMILEADQWLGFDTAFTGFTNAFESLLLPIARDYDGLVDANALVRFQKPVRAITVRDSGASTTRVDTLPRYFGGTIVVKIDTLKSRGGARFAIYRTTEDWDAQSATWALRIDSGNVELPWSTPGGTRGAKLGEATWAGAGTGAGDSITIALDSLTVADWVLSGDSLAEALFTIDEVNPPSPRGTLLRLNAVVLRLSAHSSVRRDTVVEVPLTSTAQTFIYDPQPARISSAPQVSGVPAWRTVFGLRNDFESLVFPCPDQQVGCTLQLKQVHVNLAELLLEPGPAPPGFTPEDSILVEIRSLIRNPVVPLERSPIGEGIGGNTEPIAPARFAVDAPAGPPVKVGITPLITALLADTTGNLPRHLAMISLPESATFGIAAFKPRPRLRLILTLTPEQRR